MSRPNTPNYRMQNWPAYNEALKRRDSLTIHWPAADCLQSPQGWFDTEMTWEAKPTGKGGRQPVCSGEEDQKTVRGTVFPTNAIQTCLTMKVLFGMALRQTRGSWKACCGWSVWTGMYRISARSAAVGKPLPSTSLFAAHRAVAPVDPLSWFASKP